MHVSSLLLGLLGEVRRLHLSVEVELKDSDGLPTGVATPVGKPSESFNSTSTDTSRFHWSGRVTSCHVSTFCVHPRCGVFPTSLRTFVEHAMAQMERHGDS